MKTARLCVEWELLTDNVTDTHRTVLEKSECDPKTGTWKHRTHCLQFRYKLPFAKSRTRALLVIKIITITWQRSSQTPQSSTGKIVPTCVHSWQAAPLRHLSTNMFTQESLRIRPTDVAASNNPSGNGSCFSVYIFTALGPLIPPLDCPPNGIHSHLSREKPSPFRKCCGGCTVGWAKRRAERRDVTISTALPQF